MRGWLASVSSGRRRCSGASVGSCSSVPLKHIIVRPTLMRAPVVNFHGGSSVVNTGHIIFLNGTSSAGKTTIAHSLQEQLAQPYMHISTDMFFHMYPERFVSPTRQEEAEIFAGLVPAVVSGFHRSVAVWAKAGNNMIVDHVLQEDGWLEECVENWMGLDVCFVGVKCPLEIAEQREMERGDRNIGTARYQYDRVHRHGLYDVQVDTSTLSVQASTDRIISGTKVSPSESAFGELVKLRGLSST